MHRKARFKGGAAVVIGVAEGTMPVDVEDDDEEDDDEDDDYDEVPSLDWPTMLYKLPENNITQVWRVTGACQGTRHRAMLAHRKSHGHSKMY
mmetsp:Transcript_16090/g.35529  ORF Transcript_16090/g.35529 Transcript_16090/m.35529 type:complete len:92 (-) Transcript_16090:379-654(-)